MALGELIGGLTTAGVSGIQSRRRRRPDASYQGLPPYMAHDLSRQIERAGREAQKEYAPWKEWGAKPMDIYAQEAMRGYELSPDQQAALARSIQETDQRAAAMGRLGSGAQAELTSRMGLDLRLQNALRRQQMQERMLGTGQQFSEMTGRSIYDTARDSAAMISQGYGGAMQYAPSPAPIDPSVATGYGQLARSIWDKATTPNVGKTYYKRGRV